MKLVAHAIPRDSRFAMDEETLLLCLLWRYRRNKKKNKRHIWVREIFQRRKVHGKFHQLLQEMRLCDAESHFRHLRMTNATFDLLLSRVGPVLRRRTYCSRLRPEIAPAERLALTLRYLATGNSQVSLSFNFRIGRSTVCNILHQRRSYGGTLGEHCSPKNCGRVHLLL